MKNSSPKAKPQPTLSGYSAWAFRRLAEAKGLQEGPTAAWIIDRWIDENGSMLAEEFHITRDQFLEQNANESEGAVIRHPSSERASDGRRGA